MIDVTFDFTRDTPCYWDEFWRDELFGHSSHDPDSESKTLQEYHRQLWSKELPNGKKLTLRCSPIDYLTWENFRLGSDSIVTSFRYKRNRNLICQAADAIPKWKEYIETYIRKSYTIGGSIIFPKMRNSINQIRGCNSFICDRWDLTIECIRKYYLDEDSPLYLTLRRNKFWFDLFVNFAGFVDFFFLQDCVSSDCKKVNFWLGNGEFKPNPLPQSVDEYKKWIEYELEFVAKRNYRINQSLQK